MESRDPHVLMVSTECRDLAKVGGLADVVRDLSKALKLGGTDISVLMPFYERIKKPAELVHSFTVRFGSRADYPVQVFRLALDGVPFYLLHSEEFFGGVYGDIYIDSDRLGRGPFEDDAQRFAFFSTAALEFIMGYPGLSQINALHCHDWHTGVLLTLLKFDPRYQPLADRLQTLFTIHNLDYQGVRPFELSGERDLISFSQWLPELYLQLKAGGNLDTISDPAAEIPCFNAMRAGINLADNVNTVSPNYAGEITRPDNPQSNFIGGRGLEGDLQKRGNRLHGILNGLDYEINDPTRLAPPYDAGLPGWEDARHQHKINFLENLPEVIEKMAVQSGQRFKNRQAVLEKMKTYRSEDWLRKPLVVLVTRAVRQKVSILFETLDGRTTALQEMLDRDISLIALGTGDLEDSLEEINARLNGLFVCAFDLDFANGLYSAGDLFLMPSDFEPCGISQMIAMRFGCLPLVAGVGGLKDTVSDMQTGFVYYGADRLTTRMALVQELDKALDCYNHSADQWKAMQERAMRARFDWKTSAKGYIELYRQQP